MDGLNMLVCEAYSYIGFTAIYSIWNWNIDKAMRFMHTLGTGNGRLVLSATWVPFFDGWIWCKQFFSIKFAKQKILNGLAPGHGRNLTFKNIVLTNWKHTHVTCDSSPLSRSIHFHIFQSHQYFVSKGSYYNIDTIQSMLAHRPASRSRSIICCVCTAHGSWFLLLGTGPIV